MIGPRVERFRARYPARPSYVGVIRGEVAAVALERGFSGEGLGDVRLAVSEAATNAVVHGSAGRADARVGVRVELTESEMLVTVSDDGEGLMPRIDSAGLGAGLPIIAAITGQLDVRSGPEGTDVHMSFRCPAGRAEARRLDDSPDTRAKPG
jgi:anti-sigma regulatory factor (Ser/Thr protein kinase)